VAITDQTGTVTDTFKYDTYGKLLSRTGSTDLIFGYNGRDGVVTDTNGLIYMRARYYSPELRRFVNADIIPGAISQAVTLNRYAYANGNPVSNVDPFGLAAEDKSGNSSSDPLTDAWEAFAADFSLAGLSAEVILSDDTREIAYSFVKNHITTAPRPSNISKRRWKEIVKESLRQADELYGSSSAWFRVLNKMPDIGIALDAVVGLSENYAAGSDWKETVGDLGADVGIGIMGVAVSSAAATTATTAATVFASSMITGAAAGSVVPVLGTIAGAVVGVFAGLAFTFMTEYVELNGQSMKEDVSDGITELLEWIF